MNKIINFGVIFIALEHIAFAVLEMIFWNHPIGLKVFKISSDFALQSQNLAANQGLYNLFLSAGLIWSLLQKNSQFSTHLKLFFLLCVLTAGLFGAFTVGIKILILQALPASLFIALIFVDKKKA